MIICIAKWLAVIMNTKNIWWLNFHQNPSFDLFFKAPGKSNTLVTFSLAKDNMAPHLKQIKISCSKCLVTQTMTCWFCDVLVIVEIEACCRCLNCLEVRQKKYCHKLLWQILLLDNLSISYYITCSLSGQNQINNCLLVSYWKGNTIIISNKFSSVNKFLPFNRLLS